ncbi:MAG: glutamine--fructose-6-phosphate transaminase (isomerizing) [Candidatus Rokuibacteriota bacterium]|nr:MAG: glutamine--fructose-6-phosphate transaminase (isomerizing) [Candidatus Rokubacteria bacterium]PYM66804.1 MAG: glutamine--fructose-6-phosphate transaminase (isomerizing) [Candidatus Rokubacteria bacterium]PYN69926.1 MAG: glutamine--fructose-6-phosphate transaminase (isomerizing) [Candidatus Rokubacteria bacterium]
MCGIVGYVGDKNAVSIIVEGLKRLEYRGYDSAGVAVLHDGTLHVRRAAGRIKTLEGILRERPVTGSLGIGHTRWATHGRPSDENAHPHTDCRGELVVVHNGILENYLEIKDRLQGEGHAFRSETDTEVLAHLIEHHLKTTGRLERAVKAALAEVTGSYAIGVVATAAPDRLIAAKQGAGSVVVGLGHGEMFVASDIPAILSHTRDVVILEDNEVAVVTAAGVELSTLDDEPVQRDAVRILWDPIMAEKGGYRHFMLKEIHEQPRAITDTFRGRIAPETGTVVLPDVNLDPATVKALERVVFVACGTAFHAATLGRTMVERLAGLGAEVDLASEFRYRDAIVGPETLVVAISQSGETADTLGAVKAARLKGCPILAITNVVGSALAREATGVLYMHAGPEIGVASTKAFATMIVAVYLLGLWLGRQRNAITTEEVKKRIHDLVEIPRLIEKTLELDGQIMALARELAHARDFLYLGRGLQYPIALEGALKLKEISYIHAEGYAGGEMKHGPIALIADELPVVALAVRDGSYERMLGNIEEVRARDGLVVAVAHTGDRNVASKAKHVIGVPPCADLLAPLVTVVPLQLLAYHIAVRLGCDVDQPRNLAKSVTVE